MWYMVVVSIIWAFSFGLIKTYLAGMDPFLVSAMRIGVALMVFLPFLRLGTVSFNLFLKLFVIGAVQFGLMYGTYIYTYQFMEAHKIALFTVTTPLMVTLIDDFLEKRFQTHYFLCAALAVVGAVVIYYKTIDLSDTLIGICLLQLSNLCFAIGQVFYRRIMLQNDDLKSRDHFGVLYLGGFIATLILVFLGTDLETVSISMKQFQVILFLGVLASGIGFFLWNYGATKTNAGTLAVMNNLKIPLAVTVSLLFFESVSGEALIRLLMGGAIIVGAVYLNERISARVKRESS
ncbi:MAG: EamA family transporter [Opitutales bacterium]|jgi:drug/metabolite transporter (DMT)-like permease|nr:EamA family transporter [Opitutales bacterium]